MAVMRATRRLKALSRRSSSSSGSGSSTSATRGRGALADLLPHRVLARLERGHEALRLLLEQLAALVEPLAGAALRLGGELLRTPRHVPAALGQHLARLPSRLRRQEERGGGADHAAQKEPAEVARGVASLVTHRDLLGCGRAAVRTHRSPA